MLLQYFLVPPFSDQAPLNTAILPAFEQERMNFGVKEELFKHQRNRLQTFKAKEVRIYNYQPQSKPQWASPKWLLSQYLHLILKKEVKKLSVNGQR